MKRDDRWGEWFDDANVGDTVMTPINVSATVTEVLGHDAYSEVVVKERTPDGLFNRWRQNQLIVQSRAWKLPTVSLEGIERVHQARPIA